jgi:DNA-binding response OmpR family regulator
MNAKWEALSRDGLARLTRWTTSTRNSPPDAAPAPEAGLRRSILVVDDEVPVCLALQRSLIEHGFDVTVAHGAERASRLCARHTYDVVLLDVRMPGVDGVEALRRLRLKAPRSRFIMMTAYGVRALEAELLRGGAIALLHKPLHLPTILELMREPEIAQAR